MPNTNQLSRCDEILRRCADADPTALQDALNINDRLFLKAATHYASIAGIKCLLDRKSTFLEAEQTVLAEAALTGKADILRFVLERNPNIILSEDVRYYAVIGGVPIWRELIAFDPDCPNIEIGHHGDALGLAVSRNNAALVAFLLNEGKADVQRSNYSTMPVLPFAVRQNRSQEIVDLLISHGAPMKDDLG